MDLNWDIKIWRNGTSISFDNELLEELRVERPVTDKVGEFEFFIDNDPTQDIKEGDTIQISIANEGTTLTPVLTGEILRAKKEFKEGFRTLYLTGKDWSTLFQRRKVNKEYSNVRADTIILDIVSDLVSEGEITTSNVETCTIPLDIVFRERTEFEALREVADRVGYDWYLDTNRDLHFFLRDSRASGKTLTIENLENYLYYKDASKIINTISVLGAKRVLPPDYDWAESLTDWTYYAGTISLYDRYSWLAPKAGSYSVGCAADSTPLGTFQFGRACTLDLTGPGAFTKLSFWFGSYIPSGKQISSVKVKLEAPDPSNYFIKDITSLLSVDGSEWSKISLDLGTESSWTEGGSPNWNNITEVIFEIVLNQTDPDWIIYIDMLCFRGGRYRGSAEDQDSQTNWGVRETPNVLVETVLSDKEAEDLAQEIIDTFKGPIPVLKLAPFEGYESLKPGETITIEIPEDTLTLRILNLSHIIKEGEYYNELVLANYERELSEAIDRLRKRTTTLEQREPEPLPDISSSKSYRPSLVVDSGTSFPSGPSNGDLFYRTDLDAMFRFNGSDWEKVAKTIGEGTSFPSEKYIGDVFYRTDLNASYRWTGSTWSPIHQISTHGTIFPSNPTQGDFFYNTIDAYLYRYDGANWYKVMHQDFGSTWPSSPEKGDTFYHSDYEQTFYFDGNTWSPLATISRSGSAWPSDYVEGDIFYRTDLNEFYRYNGTDWLAVHPRIRSGSSWPSVYEKGDLFYRTDTNVLFRRTDSIWERVVQITDEGATDPSQPQIGDLFYRTDLNVLRRWDGSTWHVVHQISTHGSSFPASPNLGDFFYNTDDEYLYRYDGTDWYKVMHQASGSTFPASPEVGDTFYHTDYEQTFFWDSTNWLPLATISRSGTAFPADKAEGDVFFNTDENKFYRWDGSTWTLVTLPPEAVSKDNLIFNAEFEIDRNQDGISDGWEGTFEIAGGGGGTVGIGTGIKGSNAQFISCSNSPLQGRGVASDPIPVVAGGFYTLIARVKSNVATSNGLYLRVLWYANKTNIGRFDAISLEDIVSSGPTETSWQRYSGVVGPAPSNAKYARIAFYNWEPNVDATFYFDDFIFKEEPTFASENLVMNPSFEYDTWGGDESQDNVEKRFGNYSVKLLATSSSGDQWGGWSNYINVKGLDRINMSVFIKITQIAGSALVVAYYQAYNSSYSVLETKDICALSATQGWTKHTLTKRIADFPSGTVFIRVSFGIKNVDSAVATIAYWDGWQVHSGALLPPFQDSTTYSSKWMPDKVFKAETSNLAVGSTSWTKVLPQTGSLSVTLKERSLVIIIAHIQLYIYSTVGNIAKGWWRLRRGSISAPDFERIKVIEIAGATWSSPYSVYLREGDALVTTEELDRGTYDYYLDAKVGSTNYNLEVDLRSIVILTGVKLG